MAKKEKDKPQLDTETTVADMNVEGFAWYDPAKKQGKKAPPSLTKKEQRALIRGAYKAMLPMICCIAVVGVVMFLLIYLWLK